MIRISAIVLFTAGACIWGDWKNIRKYYPTMLYVVTCSLLYLALYDNYPLWRFEPRPPLDRILSNDAQITLVLTFSAFLCSTLIYLSKYPAGWKQVPFIALFVGLYSLIEVASFFRGGITYHNGWNFGWSIFFNACMFLLIRIHYLNPFIGWGASAVFTGSIWLVFGFPAIK